MPAPPMPARASAGLLCKFSMPRIDNTGQFGSRCSQQAHQLRRRRGDQAQQLRPDLLQTRQLGKGELPYLGVLFKKSGDYERAASVVPRRRIF